jgi:uncharacterized phage-associated protein
MIILLSNKHVMEKALAVANYFIKKSLETGIPLTPMHVIKLTYIAHGWHLGFTNEPLLNEAVEAWKYGPVIPSIYHTFKKYGSQRITKLENEVDIESSPMTICQPLTTGERETDLLDKVFNVYGKYSALQLSALTHQDNTPWDITFKTKGEGALIPNDTIEQHYKEKINASRTARATGGTGGATN